MKTKNHQIDNEDIQHRGLKVLIGVPRLIN